MLRILGASFLLLAACSPASRSVNAPRTPPRASGQLKICLNSSLDPDLHFPFELRATSGGAELATEGCHLVDLPAHPTELLRIDFAGRLVAWMAIRAGQQRGLASNQCCVLDYDGNRRQKVPGAQCAQPRAETCPTGLVEISPGLADDPLCGNSRRCMPPARARVVIEKGQRPTITNLDAMELPTAKGEMPPAYGPAPPDTGGFVPISVNGVVELFAFDSGSAYTLYVRDGRVVRVDEDQIAMATSTHAGPAASAPIEWLAFCETYPDNLPEPDEVLFGDQAPCNNQGIDSVPKLAALSSLSRLYLLGDVSGGLAFLAGLPLLEELHVSSSSEEDLKPLAYLRQLKVLSIDSSGTLDLASLGDLQRLTNLALNARGYRGLEALGDLTSLEDLALDTRVAFSSSFEMDLTPLARLGKKLKILSIHSSGGINLAGLRDLDQVTTLELSGTAYRGLEALGAMASLENLTFTDIQQGQIVAPPRLVRLDLRSGDTVSLKVVANLIHLEHLGVDAIGIRDFRFLKRLSKLRSLSLSASSYDEEIRLDQLAKLRRWLPHLEITVLGSCDPFVLAPHQRPDRAQFTRWTAERCEHQ